MNSLETDNYREYLYEGSPEKQLEKLGLDWVDFVIWGGDQWIDTISELVSNTSKNVPIPWESKKDVESLFDEFIGDKIDNEVHRFDLEGLPYNGQ